MNHGHKILVVAQRPSLGARVLTLLGDANHEVAVVTTFAAAKLHLTARPDLLITEVKLGEYNGLHLALRGRAAGIPAIVVGAPDQTFERQAIQLGAVYLGSPDLMAEELLPTVERLLSGIAPAEPEPVPWLDERVPVGFAEARDTSDEPDAESPASRPVIVH